MELLLQANKHISAYLDGLLSASDLQDWLADVSPGVSENESEARFAANIWRVISEYGYGHRDENSLRSELVRLVPGVRVESSTTTGRVATLAQTVQASVIQGFQPSAPSSGSQSDAYRLPAAV